MSDVSREAQAQAIRDGIDMLRGMLRFPEDLEGGDAEIADILAALDSLLAATPVAVEPARCNEADAFVVTGHYCATDANPEEDAADERTAVVVATREEAENWLLWFPGGEIIPAVRQGF